MWIQSWVWSRARLGARNDRISRGFIHRCWVLKSFSHANAAVMLALALVASGSGSTTTAHMTSL